jgi:hypothetical protein
LEYITAYKQWYCYNCQTYVDLPEQKESDKTTAASDTESGNEPGTLPDTPTPIAEDSKPDTTDNIDIIELATPSDDATVTEISWDDAVELDEEIDIDAGEDAEDQDGNEEEDTEEQDGDEQKGVEEEQEDTGVDLNDENVEIDDTDTLETIDFNETSDVHFDSESESEHNSEEPTTDNVIMAGTFAGVDLSSDTIENLSADQVEIEIDNDYAPAVEILEIPEHDSPKEPVTQDPDLKRKAIAKLHQAWVKVTSLKGLTVSDPRVLQLEEDLKRFLDGKYDPLDCIVVADESIEESNKLEKELREIFHQEISDLFHFVNSKIFLARKIGFNVEALEEHLDNISSLIARGEYHQARSELEYCLIEIKALPEEQDEIMIGLDLQSDIMQELLEPPNTNKS